MIKYFCCGGWITSKNDGQKHYISAHRVAELYKVNSEECLFKPKEKPLLGVETKGLIRLNPRDDGDYALPHRGGLNDEQGD
jgi:hypothetical protein